MIKARTLIHKLQIVDENILLEAAYQPQLFMLAARYRVGKMRLRARAVAEYDYYVANLAMTIRNKRDKSGRKSFTEGALKERVQTNSTTRLLQRAQNQAYEIEELSKQILRAYEMRREAIRIIADARNSEVLREAREISSTQQRAKLRREASRLHRRSMELDEE